MAKYLLKIPDDVYTEIKHACVNKKTTVQDFLMEMIMKGMPNDDANSQL